MEFLKILESIRNGLLDNVCLILTNLGSEVVISVILCLVYWCVNKKLGFKIGFSYLIAGFFVNIIKIMAKIPRPFNADTSLTVVEGAKSTAGGYSFPSGHTQSSTSVYGTFSLHFGKHNVLLSILFFIPIIIVAFTRMYLGVHTPLDVLAGFFLALFINIVVSYIFDNFWVDPSHFRAILIVISILSFGLILLGVYEMVYAGVTAQNGLPCVKTGAGILGFIIGWYIEVTYVKFNETGIDLPGQILKFITGILGVVVLYFCIGELFKYFFGRYHLLTNTIPYFLTTLWIAGIFPIFIKKVFTSPFNFRL